MARSRRLSAATLLRCATSIGILAHGCDAPPPGGTLEPSATAGSGLFETMPDVNVVVVSFDAMRADALGAYGGPPDVSPNLDAFARESVVFEKAYSTAPVTPTSFAAAFTGRYPNDVFQGWQLSGVPTLANRFARAGYATGGFLNNPHLTRDDGFAIGFETFHNGGGYDDREGLDRALTWLREVADSKFFLWIHLIDPHTPYDARESSSHLYDPDYSGPYEETSTGSILFEHDPNELERLRSLYAGEVHFVDGAFGRVLATLRELDLLDRSLVVATSDHGEEFMEHGRLQHGWITEENVRIPLIVRHPRGPRGVRIASRVTNLDLLPTLLEIAGLGLPRHLDGRSLARVPDGKRPVVLVNHTARGWRAAAIVDGDDKLLIACGKRAERALYDLGADPEEEIDRSHLFAQRAAELESRLWRELEVAGCPQLSNTPLGRTDRPRRLSRETVEALRRLGYIEDAPEP